MPLNIAIVGAGPAGCMLARLLQHANKDVKVTIFESDTSPNFRSQGGTLDLHDATGQAALKEAGLFDEFLKFARYDGEAFKICDKSLLCYVKLNGSKNASSSNGRPEIDRPQLRKLLYDSLNEGTVQWNRKLAKVDKDINLHFADGTTETTFDLVVGADGGWSKVRSLLSDVKPFYSGISGHALRISNAEQCQPELFALVNRGSLFSWSDGKSIMGQYMGDGSLNVSTWALRPEDWQKDCSYDVRDTEAFKAACREEYKGWDPRLRAFTEAADDASAVPRDLYMLPVGYSWQHVSGVTLIGDAAHLATPFAGEGVNLAFEDCLKLSKAILSVPGTTSATEDMTRTKLDTKVAEFEQDMFERARKMQQLTYDMMQAMFMTPGAPRQGIEKYILRAMGDEMGSWMTLLLTPIVYTWFFVFKLIW